MNNVITKHYPPPPINTKEVLRYANGSETQNTLKLLNECINEVSNDLTYTVCYIRLKLKINSDVCDFDLFKVKSYDLAKNLSGCKSVIVFAATVGVMLDRQINKYLHISPAKALLIQAFGSERIESLCDAFSEDIKNSFNIDIKPRFSAGYGDLPLETQKEIFALLNCAKNIGLTLNDSLVMSPTKSVTAFIGIKEV